MRDATNTPHHCARSVRAGVPPSPARPSPLLPRRQRQAQASSMRLALGAARRRGSNWDGRGKGGRRRGGTARGRRSSSACIERQRGPHPTTGGDSAAAGTLAGPPQGDARPRGDLQPGERCRLSPRSAATMVYMRASPQSPHSTRLT